MHSSVAILNDQQLAQPIQLSHDDFRMALEIQVTELGAINFNGNQTEIDFSIDQINKYTQIVEINYESAGSLKSV